jgi:uncharacterized protein HemX
MDERKGQNIGVSNRSQILIIILGTLLLASLSWNAWQYRAAEQHRKAMAAEQIATAQVEEAKLEAEQRRLKRARDAKNDERIQQLDREIDSLTRINEQLQMPRRVSTSAPPKTDDLEQTVNFP